MPPINSLYGFSSTGTRKTEFILQLYFVMLNFLLCIKPRYELAWCSTFFLRNALKCTSFSILFVMTVLLEYFAFIILHYVGLLRVCAMIATSQCIGVSKCHTGAITITQTAFRLYSHVVYPAGMMPLLITFTLHLFILIHPRCMRNLSQCISCYKNSDFPPDLPVKKQEFDRVLVLTGPGVGQHLSCGSFIVL